MMFSRLVVSSALAGLVFLCLPQLANAADRGPSTPEERKQALVVIHDWQADPLGPNAKDQFGQVLKFFAAVPDLTVHMCTILDKLPKGDKKDSSIIVGGEFMAQAAFALERTDKSEDLLAEYETGVEGALRIYQNLVKANPKDDNSYLDELVQRREAGTLAEYVKGRASASCKK